jgi:hypothetical protein
MSELLTDTNINSGSLTSIQARADENEKNIGQLENLSVSLTEQLNSNIANNNTDSNPELTNQILSINDIIRNLHQNQSELYSVYNTMITSTEKSLEEQGYATNIVSTELGNTTMKLGTYDQQKANKLRLIEINDYYSEQYLDRTNIMKSVILVCIPLIILTVLKNKGLINKNLFNWLIIILIVIAGIYLFRLFLKAISHNNMQYQQYDWNFNINAAPPVDTTYPNGDPADKIKTTTCSTK